MKNIIEALGETVAELVGAIAVLIGLSAALVFLNGFADDFISYFI